jgi:hypothetical protein
MCRTTCVFDSTTHCTPGTMRAKRQIFHLSSESPRDSSRQTQPGEPIVTMRALQSAEHAATYVALNITRTLDEVLVQSVGLHRATCVNASNLCLGLQQRFLLLNVHMPDIFFSARGTLSLVTALLTLFTALFSSENNNWHVR